MSALSHEDIERIRSLRGQLQAKVARSITASGSTRTLADPMDAASYVVNALTHYDEGLDLLAALLDAIRPAASEYQEDRP